jgi:hypothetical protein
LNLQSLAHCHWSRVPNANLRCQQLKLSDLRGWSVFVEDAGKNFIDEKSISIDLIFHSSNASCLHPGR